MANSDNRYEMLPLRELSKLSWVKKSSSPHLLQDTFPANFIALITATPSVLR